MLDEKLLFNLDNESVRRSFGPKAAGAWYLHKHSMEDEIRHFVVYSSITAAFGNVGQTNYAASNSYLDALVRVRQMQGLPGVSVQWPSIAEVGMAAGMEGSVKISEEAMLDLMSVKKTLKQVTVSSSGVSDAETVKIPLPQLLLMEDNFMARVQPFVSKVAIKNEQAVVSSSTRSRRTTHTRSKVWSMEEVRSEVEAAVRAVMRMVSGEAIVAHVRVSHVCPPCHGLAVESSRPPQANKAPRTPTDERGDGVRARGSLSFGGGAAVAAAAARGRGA